jgi:hypothetical protein
MERFLSESLDVALGHKKEGAKHEPGKASKGECLVHIHASMMVDGKEWAAVAVDEGHPLYNEDKDGCRIPVIVDAALLRNDPSLHTKKSQTRVHETSEAVALQS